MAQTRRVSGVATSVITHSNGTVACIYHGTTVAQVSPTGHVTLDTGGWFTVTTKTRMNQFANEYCGRAFAVWQNKGAWFARVGEGVPQKFTGNRLEFDIPV